MKITDADTLGASILIVDDQASNVQLLQELLAGEGYTYVSATMDSREVCGLHHTHRYDLILLDLQMPHMDGFEVMQCLNAIETEAYAPVLAITAQPGHKLRALASGAKDFISKPYDLVEVKTRIRNMLELRLIYKKMLKTNRELETLALRDSLTGVANRRLLMDRLEHAMRNSARTGDHCALMFMDLDHFKALNDSFGHDAGDDVLKQAAARLQVCVREGDTVARLGGDEFVVLLEGLGAKATDAATQARGVTQKILTAFGTDFQIGAHTCASTFSIGAVIFRGSMQPVQQLLKNADLAMYDAKAASRNTVRFYEPSLHK